MNRVKIPVFFIMTIEESVAKMRDDLAIINLKIDNNDFHETHNTVICSATSNHTLSIDSEGFYMLVKNDRFPFCFSCEAAEKLAKINYRTTPFKNLYPISQKSFFYLLKSQLESVLDLLEPISTVYSNAKH